MKLQPSTIHFSQEMMSHFTSKILMHKQCPAKIINQQCSSMVNRNNLPKLQVFKKDGCYFALDNNSLLLYRRLELGGSLGEDVRVEVDIVSTKKIPKNIFNSSECSSAEESSSSEHSDYSDENSDSFDDIKCPYDKLQIQKPKDEEKSKKLPRFWSSQFS